MYKRYEALFLTGSVTRCLFLDGINRLEYEDEYPLTVTKEVNTRVQSKIKRDRMEHSNSYFTHWSRLLSHVQFCNSFLIGPLRLVNPSMQSLNPRTKSEIKTAFRIHRKFNRSSNILFFVFNSNSPYDHIHLVVEYTESVQRKTIHRINLVCYQSAAGTEIPLSSPMWASPTRRKGETFWLQLLSLIQCCFDCQNQWQHWVSSAFYSRDNLCYLRCLYASLIRSNYYDTIAISVIGLTCP